MCWHQRLTAVGSPPQTSLQAAPLPSLARTLPTPRPGASRGTPTPGPAFGTESPHCPAPPLQLVPASTEELAGSGRPPAHDGAGTLPGGEGCGCNGLNDSSKLKTRRWGWRGAGPWRRPQRGLGQEAGRAGRAVRELRRGPGHPRGYGTCKGLCSDLSELEEATAAGGVGGGGPAA